MEENRYKLEEEKYPANPKPVQMYFILNPLLHVNLWSRFCGPENLEEVKLQQRQARPEEFRSI